MREPISRTWLIESLSGGSPAPPADPSLPRAAVAAVFRERHPHEHPLDIELLFIERATWPGDPWSGQMALPGGRAEPHDPDANATAERETREELGLDLDGHPRIGQLADVIGGQGSSRRVSVSAHAYWLEGPRPDLEPNHEVATTIWVPLSELADPARHVDYRWPANPGQTYPGVAVGDGRRVVWGLTLRFLADLHDRLGVPFVITSR